MKRRCHLCIRQGIVSAKKMTSSKHSPPSVAVGHDHDMEAGGVGGWTTPHETEFADPFDIGNTKNASIETLQRWRVRSIPHGLFLVRIDQILFLLSMLSSLQPNEEMPRFIRIVPMSHGWVFIMQMAWHCLTKRTADARRLDGEIFGSTLT